MSFVLGLWCGIALTLFCFWLAEHQRNKEKQ